LRFAVLVAITVLTFTTHADPDLWGHVRFGQDILAARAIPVADPYSFSSDRPWVNHEWLAEIVMAASYELAGSVGLVLLKTALVAIMLAILLWSLGTDRLPTVPHDFLVFLAVAASFSRIVPVRPQLFSLVLFCGLLAFLKQSERHPRALLPIPVLFIAWVNLHGGWLVGLGTLLGWSMVRLVAPSTSGLSPLNEDRIPERGATSAADRRRIASVAILAVLATFVNPYGARMWTFLYETVGFVRPDIRDWQPIVRLPLGFVMPWALGVITAILAVARGGWPPNPARALVCSMLAIGSALVSRLDAFFGLSVVLLLAPQVARAWPRSATRREQPEASKAAGRPARSLRLVLAASAVAAGLAIAHHPTCVAINPEWAPEPDLVNVISSHARTGRMLTWFNWGEYVIWFFGPDLKVSIDGRRETVYSDPLISDHLDFYFDRPSGRDLAERLNPTVIWLPSSLPVVGRLVREGWIPIYRGPVSVVLARNAAPGAPPAAGDPTAARCFPGP
jgi:hypothetical protein